ncbi:MAG: RNA polymerase sigma factor [Candidatus Doudnabacteria bacterium]|nr:RNA polymerase sigma factor [Candidatus Doudnabacteria bacterium]
MVSENDVQKLVVLAQNGDSEAFGQIYDQYARQIHNFLLGKLRHQQVCEDLVHTVFLKAWTNLKSYHQRTNVKFSTWLFQIANYTLIDYWRTKKPTAELVEIENLADFATDPQLYEEYGYLWKAVSKLPLNYQTVLDLRFKRDLSVEETAEIMNKSSVGIRVLQHRALRALKNKLKEILE